MSYEGLHFPLYFYPSLLSGMLRSFQSCLALCDSMDCSPSGSSVHGSGLPFPPLEDLSDPGITPTPLKSPALACWFFTTKPPRKPFWVWQDFSNICEAQDTGTNESLGITCLNILNFKSNQYIL